MPILDCSVGNCTYNKEDFCCRGNIAVSGNSAESSENTCCSSFQEKREGSFSNSIQQCTPTMSVSCSASSCVFNETQSCNADHIGISGCSAHHMSQTECSSFRNQ